MPSDNFTGTAGQALGTYSTNWTVNANAADISINATSNGAVSTVATASPNDAAVAFWNASSANADQFSQVSLHISTLVSVDAIGVCVRCDSSGNCYGGFFYPANNQGYIILMASSGGEHNVTTLASDGTAWTYNDVLRLEIVGSVLQLKRNGTVTATVTDTTYTTGQYGIAFFAGADATNWVYAWSAGDLTTSTDQLYPAYAEATANTAMIGRRYL